MPAAKPATSALASNFGWFCGSMSRRCGLYLLMVIIPYRRIWRLQHPVDGTAVHPPQNQARCGNLLQERHSYQFRRRLWILIGRGIGGSITTLTGLLAGYVDEYCFRYNRRHNGNQQFKTIWRGLRSRSLNRLLHNAREFLTRHPAHLIFNVLFL